MIDPAMKAGRTELVLEGNAALGMIQSERLRYELIEAIAQDTRKIRSLLSDLCMVNLEGLNSHIEWGRVSAGELLLYVPYTMAVENCGG